MAARTAPTRWATGVPAVSSRSTGSGSGLSILRTVGARGADARARLGRAAGAGPRRRAHGLDRSSSSASTASAAAGRRRARSSRGRPRTGRAAWRSRRPARPRPNWATRPVMVRSVTTATAVPSSSGVSVAVMVALALPWPRVSRPSARSTATCVASSCDRNVALPLYCAVMGPTLTFTMPRYSSPSISWSCAPGRHGRDQLDVGEHRPRPLDRHAPLGSRWSAPSLEVLHGVDVPGLAAARYLPHELGPLRASAPARPRRRSRAAAARRPRPAAPGCPRTTVVGRHRDRRLVRRGRDGPPGRRGDRRLVGQPDHDRVVARVGGPAHRAPGARSRSRRPSARWSAA